MLFLVIVSMTPAYGETNLVVNGGFESGTDGWAGRSCKVEAVTTPVHSGSGAAKAFERTDDWQGIKQSMLGKMSSGQTYKISGWVRLENASSDTITVSIEQADDNGTKYINVTSATAGNSEWVELSGEFKLDATGTLKTLDVYFEGPEADVNFFVDDVSVTVVSSAPAEKPDANAPKSDPNAPKGETEARASESQSGVITQSAKMSAEREAVLRGRD
jgi:hypothetical protein